jgi:hypothetical protein
MNAFGAKCQQGRVVFTTPESLRVQGGDDALGPYSPIRTTLKQCCDHAFVDLSDATARQSEKLAYDIHEKSGLLKWLGPVYDANAARKGSGNRGSSSSSSGSSIRSSEQYEQDERRMSDRETGAPEEVVVADMLHNKGGEMREVTFAEGHYPRYFIRPFGDLLHRGKTPRPKSFGVAYVRVVDTAGFEDHRFQFGQVLGLKNNRYVFWAPHLLDKTNAPGSILLSPGRFAPVFIDEKLGLTFPKVRWAYDETRQAAASVVPKPVKSSSERKEPTTPSKTQEDALSDKMSSRLRRVRATCRSHMDAKELIEDLKSNLKSEQRQRESRRKPSNLDRFALEEIRKKEDAWSARVAILRRQLVSTRELLLTTDSTCSKDIDELLAQEEADRCRHDAVDLIDPNEVALRKTIERGEEGQARRAIQTFLASHGDMFDRTLGRNKLKECSAKILAPWERERAFPESLVRLEMEAASKGLGFSRAAEAKLLRDCRGSKSMKLIETLLKNKAKRDVEHGWREHDKHDWEQIKENLTREKSARTTRTDALLCEKSIDALLKSARTQACRDVLFEALRKTGVKSDRNASASDLGKLFSLKVRAAREAAREGKKTEVLRVFQESLSDERVHGCLDALDLPDLSAPHVEEKQVIAPYSQEVEKLLISCEALNDEVSEMIIGKIMQSLNEKVLRDAALRELLERLRQLTSREVPSCKAAAERMLALHA